MLKSTKKIHLLLIITGTLFISAGIFHTNLWFDETFSVSLASHSFREIWSITANDVHPPLYYWMLRVLSLIFGKNILIYRLFSMLGIASFASLGYTHIRNDLGEKAGITFSFLAFFLPVMCIYANEIRMYSWTMVFVTLAFIYAYRILKTGTKTYWCLFTLFSLASAYTHYYGLLAVGMINAALFVYLCLGKQINQLKLFLIAASIQILLYLPWLFILIKQLHGLSAGFWIELTFPKTLIQIISFQFGGDLATAGVIHTNIAFAIAVILY
ncbi:MAG: glycosyltransferase family 39 protein, partial [Negativicutes bacterium]|nr:glycosyltransferase family 39 protein [Negativicutes bacterium]